MNESFYDNEGGSAERPSHLAVQVLDNGNTVAQKKHLKNKENQEMEKMLRN